MDTQLDSPVVARRTAATARVLQSDLVEMTSRCGRLEDDLAAARTEAEVLRTDRATVEGVLRGEIDHLRQRVADLEQDLDHSLGAAARLVLEVESSRSWRVTEPLRRVALALRGGPRRTARPDDLP